VILRKRGGTLFALFFGVMAARSASSQLIQFEPERTGHAATRLESGKVLITGGVNETSVLASALLYDPATGAITGTGSMTKPRQNHTSTLLNDGGVLITGGDQGGDPTVVLQSAEIYDPAVGVFTATSQGMSNPRTLHTATLLPTGTVLITGGGLSADIFDPTNDSFTKTTGNPVQDRKSHMATKLADGKVLITGGYIDRISSDTAEVYDPATQAFTVAPNSMIVPRANHTSTLLPSGKVLITGGFSGTSPHDETEIYDPATQTFALDTPMLYHRSNHQALLLGDGQVLVIGGVTLEGGFLAVDEVYDPFVKTWTEHDQLLQDRAGCSATTLLSGNIFVAGGVSGNETLQSAEILDPVTQEFTSLEELQAPRNQHTATLLQDGKVLLAAGSTDTAPLTSAELFDSATNSFTLLGSTLSDDRKSHTATLLDDGRVLIAGGKNSQAIYLRSAELFNPLTGLFDSANPMNSVRALHAAVLLDDGRPLEIGGVITGGAESDTAETFDPVTESFSLTAGKLNIARKRHRASLLSDGTVLVSGGEILPNGQTGEPITATAELFDSVTGLFTQVGDMTVARVDHDSTVLEAGTVLVTGGTNDPQVGDIYDPATQSFSPTANIMLEARTRLVALRLTNPAWGSLQGKVLAIGGSTKSGDIFGGGQKALDSVEIYDPATRLFSNFGTMTVARQNHTATELQDGRVLVTGGVGPPFVSGTAEIVAAPTPSPTPTPIPTATPEVTKPLNISTRVDAETGDNVLIGGFIITGVDMPKKVMVRAIGPSLSLTGTLTDPVLELYDSSGGVLATNDDWVDSLDKQEIIDTTIPPTDDKESAIIASLSPVSAPGTGQYTAIVHGKGSATGVALVEVYDLDPWVTGTVLANISTRGLVQTGDGVMIAGFIVSPGGSNGQMLLRGLGPSLAQFVSGALADPALDLYDANANRIASNDNWKSDQQSEIEATGIPPTNDAEAAILAMLPPGAYTVIQSGKNGGIGLGLVEVYTLQ
jgi:N-acetylneuraminic acid mutarotase